MTPTQNNSPRNWASAWPDALAFVGGLAMAWVNEWQTKDLVWSLWLSSLVVGYAMIVWNIFGPTGMRLRQLQKNGAPLAAKTALGGVYLLGGLFMMAFFTVHFGGFHFVHSIFLGAFFPVADSEARGLPDLAIYVQVLRDYWPFVIVAAVAERQAFRWSDPATEVSDTAVSVVAIEQRKARAGAGDQMIGPYKNVIRLHLLIFFFAFASFAKLENFYVYAVVYAVYFFPWRLVKR